MNIPNALTAEPAGGDPAPDGPPDRPRSGDTTRSAAILFLPFSFTDTLDGQIARRRAP